MTMNSIFKRPKPNRTRTIIKVHKMLNVVYKLEPLPVPIQVKIFILCFNFSVKKRASSAKNQRSDMCV